MAVLLILPALLSRLFIPRPSDITVLTEQTPDILILFLHHAAFTLPQFHFMADLPVSFGQVDDLLLEVLLVPLLHPFEVVGVRAFLLFNG